MKEENVSIGKKIRSLRKEKGLTMAQLGILMNLHESTINRYEQGKISSIDINILKKFADVLHTTVTEFTNDNEETAERMKNAIDKSGLTLYELQDMTKISKSAIQRYISGTTDKIPFSAIEKIAKAIGISPISLVGWQESPVLDKYNQLNDDQKKIIDMLLDEFIK